MQTREERIREVLLETVRQNPQGIFASDLWTLVSHDEDLKRVRPTKDDVGLNLRALERRRLVRGRIQGGHLVYTPA